MIVRHCVKSCVHSSLPGVEACSSVVLDEALVSSGSIGGDGAAAALLVGRSGVLGGAGGTVCGTFEAGTSGLLADEEDVHGWFLGTFDHSPNGEERPLLDERPLLLP